MTDVSKFRTCYSWISIKFHNLFDKTPCCSRIYSYVIFYSVLFVELAMIYVCTFCSLFGCKERWREIVAVVSRYKAEVEEQNTALLSAENRIKGTKYIAAVPCL